MMPYKFLTTGFLHHDFAFFDKAASHHFPDSLGVNFIPNCQKSSLNIYGLCPKRGMGYEVLFL
jgi:hypothetical protein